MSKNNQCPLHEPHVTDFNMTVEQGDGMIPVMTLNVRMALTNGTSVENVNIAALKRALV